jgi:hypothetical protein
MAAVLPVPGVPALIGLGGTVRYEPTMVRRFPLLAVLAAAAVLALVPVPAHACSNCQAGDPTLTAMGDEVPFAGRLRLGTVARYWSKQGDGHAHLAGDPVAQGLEELRLDVAASWSLSTRWSVAAVIPLQARNVQTAASASRIYGLGDSEVAARAVLWKSASIGPKHLLSAALGARLPTAPLQREAGGAPLPFDWQLGAGAVVPRAIASYGWLGGNVGATAAVSADLPLAGWLDYRMGPSARVAASPHWQATRWLALRLGAEARLAAADVQAGTAVHETGGAVVWAVPAVLLAPTSAWSLHLGAHLPLWGVGEPAREGPTATLGALVEL